MIITYLRSSSYNNWDFCQMQYYINYVLGWQFPAGKKADKGTIVHKVLECLATAKKVKQDSKKEKFTFEDDQIGEISVDTKSWLTPKILSKAEILKINSSRINKQTYKTPCDLQEGHCRFGVELVEELIERCFEYYKEKTHHKWYPVDFKDCTNWTWMALDYGSGNFDPRKRQILEPEQAFDFEIDEDWAEYEYKLPDGKNISGKLAIKGTVDLTTMLESDIVEVVDWKTGQRLDWANGGVKTYAKLKNDPQLLLYYYALSKLYPDIEQIILTIFYIRDGGPFSLCIDPKTLPDIENMLKDRFLEIKASTRPEMFDPTQRHFKCSRICAFYKNKFSKDDDNNICKTVHEELETYGLDFTTANRTKPGHDVGKYNAPGQ